MVASERLKAKLFKQSLPAPQEGVGRAGGTAGSVAKLAGDAAGRAASHPGEAGQAGGEAAGQAAQHSACWGGL